MFGVPPFAPFLIWNDESKVRKHQLRSFPFSAPIFCPLSAGRLKLALKAKFLLFFASESSTFFTSPKPPVIDQIQQRRRRRRHRRTNLSRHKSTNSVDNWDGNDKHYGRFWPVQTSRMSCQTTTKTFEVASAAAKTMGLMQQQRRRRTKDRLWCNTDTLTTALMPFQFTVMLGWQESCCC